MLPVFTSSGMTLTLCFFYSLYPMIFSQKNNIFLSSLVDWLKAENMAGLNSMVAGVAASGVVTLTVGLVPRKLNCMLERILRAHLHKS